MHKCESQHAWTHALRTSSLHVKQTLSLSLSRSLSVLVRRFWIKLWQDQQITTTRPNYWKNCCLGVFFFFGTFATWFFPKKNSKSKRVHSLTKKTKTKNLLGNSVILQNCLIFNHSSQYLKYMIIESNYLKFNYNFIVLGWSLILFCHLHTSLYKRILPSSFN